MKETKKMKETKETKKKAQVTRPAEPSLIPILVITCSTLGFLLWCRLAHHITKLFPLFIYSYVGSAAQCHLYAQLNYSTKQRIRKYIFE